METCPTCGARHRGAEVCRRCGTQLRDILVLEEEGAAWVTAARVALSGGDGAVARARAARACAIHRTPAALRALALALLVERRYREALDTWREVVGEAPLGAGGQP